MNTEAFETQVSGTHYKNYPMQPIELFMMLGWEYDLCAMYKYILRHQDKNGADDIKKALHMMCFADNYRLPGKYQDNTPSIKNVATIQAFCRVNNLGKVTPTDTTTHERLLLAIEQKQWVIVQNLCIHILADEYDEEPSKEILLF